MRRVVFVIGSALLVMAACGKKGLPEECDRYLAGYDCFLTKSGVADKQTTLDTMRTTWTTASETSTGRAAILTACQQSQAQMEQKFKESGCATAAK